MLELELGQLMMVLQLVFCTPTQVQTPFWLPSTLAAPRTPLGAKAVFVVASKFRPFAPSTQRLCSTQKVGTAIRPLPGGTTRLAMIMRSCLPPRSRSPSCR